MFFSGSADKPRMLFFPLINVKMPRVVGILTFRSRKYLMLSCLVVLDLAALWDSISVYIGPSQESNAQLT